MSRTLNSRIPHRTAQPTAFPPTGDMRALLAARAARLEAAYPSAPLAAAVLAAQQAAEDAYLTEPHGAYCHCQDCTGAQIDAAMAWAAR